MSESLICYFVSLGTERRQRRGWHSSEFFFHHSCVSGYDVFCTSCCSVSLVSQGESGIPGKPGERGLRVSI